MLRAAADVGCRQLLPVSGGWGTCWGTAGRLAVAAAAPDLWCSGSSSSGYSSCSRHTHSSSLGVEVQLSAAAAAAAAQEASCTQQWPQSQHPQQPAPPSTTTSTTTSASCSRSSRARQGLDPTQLPPTVLTAPRGLQQLWQQQSLLPSWPPYSRLTAPLPAAGAAGYHSASYAGLPPQVHATTILSVRKGDEVVVMGDGQATSNDFIIKPNVVKVRRLGPGVIGGFAGRAADGLALLERLEGKLEEHPGQLQRAAVELAKLWRSDKMLRDLDASLIVADSSVTLWLMGNGDVLEAQDGVLAIGSGSDFAEAAARALWQLPHTTALGIATKAMRIAADCCVYTNHNFRWLHLTADGNIASGASTQDNSRGQDNTGSSSNNSSSEGTGSSSDSSGADTTSSNSSSGNSTSSSSSAGGSSS